MLGSTLACAFLFLASSASGQAPTSTVAGVSPTGMMSILPISLPSGTPGPPTGIMSILPIISSITQPSGITTGSTSTPLTEPTRPVPSGISSIVSSLSSVLSSVQMSIPAGETPIGNATTSTATVSSNSTSVVTSVSLSSTGSPTITHGGSSGTPAPSNAAVPAFKGDGSSYIAAVAIGAWALF